MDYDEDLLVNPFYKALTTKGKELYQHATDNRWTVRLFQCKKLFQLILSNTSKTDLFYNKFFSLKRLLSSGVFCSGILNLSRILWN